MTQRDARSYLRDVLSACMAIQEFVEERGTIELAQDAFLRAAIEREFTIAAVAMWQLDRHFPEITERFTNPGRIIGLRDILVEGGHSVDPVILEDAVREQVEILEAEARGALDSLGANDSA